MLATGLTLAAAPAAADDHDIEMNYRPDRRVLMQDGRLNTLGINNFEVICTEGLYAPQGAGSENKKIRIELNSVTLPEMLREGKDLIATRMHDPLITQKPLTGSQAFSIGTDGKFKQFSTMSEIIRLAQDWAQAGKEPKGISPSDPSGLRRIENYARDFCHSRF